MRTYRVWRPDKPEPETVHAVDVSEWDGSLTFWRPDPAGGMPSPGTIYTADEWTSWVMVMDDEAMHL